MLHWTLVFLVIALIAGLLGLFGVAGVAAEIASDPVLRVPGALAGQFYIPPETRVGI
jgi:hypothetical protein